MATELIIKDPTMFARSILTPNMRFDSKAGAILVDGEPQETGKGGIRGVVICSEAAICTAEWIEDEAGKPQLAKDGEPQLLCSGAAFAYPMPEGKSPYSEIPILVEGVGLCKCSGTSWAQWNADRKVCGAYWSLGCASFPLCYFDVYQNTRATHKNYALAFRPIEWLPVAQFAQFAPNALAMKTAIGSPEPKKPTTELLSDSIPF